MKIEFTREHEVKLSKLSTKRFPVGWAGEIPDDIAFGLIVEGVAIDPAGEITKEAIVAEVERRQAIIDAGDNPDEPQPIDLDALSLAELRDLAAANGIDGAAGMKKAKLIAALEALQAPADDTTSADQG